MGRSNKRESFPDCNGPVRQAIQRLLSEGPSPLVAHGGSYQGNPGLTWEWAFLVLRAKLVTKCLSNLGQSSDLQGGVCETVIVAHHPSYRNPVVSHCGHWPKLYPKRNSGWRSVWEILYSRKIDRTGLWYHLAFSGENFMTPVSCIFPYLEKH